MLKNYLASYNIKKNVKYIYIYLINCITTVLTRNSAIPVILFVIQDCLIKNNMLNNNTFFFFSYSSYF